MAAEKFDPYHAWLGIPRRDQPAHAYRLLGIEVFEGNRSVIEAAANRQMAYLQELSSGDEHIEEAQKLLGQVSRARVVLLNPDKKAAYDKKLSAQLDSLPEASSTQVSSGVDQSGSTRVTRKTKSLPEKSSRVADLVKLAILGVVILVAIGIFIFKDPYLKVHVVDASGQPIRAEIPFTELSPEEAKNKNLFPLSLSNGNPAKWLFEEMKDDKNIIRIHDYANWPNKEYPYEIVGLEQHEFDRSNLYFFAPSLTFTLQQVEPIKITGQLKGDFEQRHFAVCLDASGQEISSTIGTTHPLSDARPTGRFIYSKAKDNGRFELADILLRSGDKPSIKVIEQEGDNFTLIGIAPIDNAGKNALDLSVKIKQSKDPKVAEKIAQGPRAVKLRGQVFVTDAENEKELVREAIQIFFDLDGDGKFMQNQEDWTQCKDGEFRIFLRKPPQGTEAVNIQFLNLPDYLEDPGPIPFPWAQVTTDGALQLPIELQRKKINVSGSVQMNPEGESAEGFIIFMDRNENAQLDKGEPETKTDAEGNFSLAFLLQADDFRKTIDGRVYRDLSQLCASSPEHATEFKVTKGRAKPDVENFPAVISGVNFLVTKQSPHSLQSETEASASNSTPDTTSGNTTTSENSGNGATLAGPPTPETAPAEFLQSVGFKGDTPEQGDPEKPEWTFVINEELVAQFTTAKRAYDRAAKKQNWGKIKELEAAKRNNDQKIETILTGAKTDSAKQRAQQQILPYNQANEKIIDELSKLNDSRDALLNPVIMTATEIENQNADYLLAMQQEEQIKQAADSLGVTIRMPTKQEISAWQPALNFLGERKLAALGLQKKGRKWISTGMAQETMMLAQIKQFAQQHFRDYVTKKKQLSALIGQNNPANQTQIDKLENQLNSQTNFASYRNAKKTFDKMTKTYLEHLNTLQTQREALKTDKQEIENVLGGDKKYQAVIKQFPEDEEMEKKRTFITNLQTLVN